MKHVTKPRNTKKFKILLKESIVTAGGCLLEIKGDAADQSLYKGAFYLHCLVQNQINYQIADF